MISRPEVMYSCRTLAKPILHDTMLQLNVLREIQTRSSSELILLEDEEDEAAADQVFGLALVLTRRFFDGFFCCVAFREDGDFRKHRHRFKSVFD